MIREKSQIVQKKEKSKKETEEGANPVQQWSAAHEGLLSEDTIYL